MENVLSHKDGLLGLLMPSCFSPGNKVFLASGVPEGDVGTGCPIVGYSTAFPVYSLPLLWVSWPASAQLLEGHFHFVCYARGHANLDQMEHGWGQRISVGTWICGTAQA